MCPFLPWSPSSQSSRCCPSLLCHLHLHQPSGKLFGTLWPVMKTFLLTEPEVKYGKIDKSRTFTRGDKTQDPTYHNIIKIHLCRVSAECCTVQIHSDVSERSSLQYSYLLIHWHTYWCSPDLIILTHLHLVVELDHSLDRRSNSASNDR